MSPRKLIFEGTAGDRLVARLELPVGEEPIAYALFAHCFTCSKDLKAAVNVSRALAARRIGVFRFDFTGLGESAGDFAGTNFSSNVGDLLAAARFMEQKLEAPRLLVGHSLGGAAVIKAAAGLESVKAVATIGAPAEPSHVTRLLTGSLQELEERGEAEVRIAGRSFRIRKQFLEDLEATRMEQAVGDLGGALLVFHSPVDRIVGIENAARIFGWAKHPKSFISLDRADHLLTDEADSQYLGAVLAAWASKYIRLAAEEEGVDTRTWAGAEDRVAVRVGSSGFRTDIMAGGHALLADEPESLGGTDTGPTPYDLLSASLGACTAMTLRMYADRKGWPLEEAYVRLEHGRVHAEDDRNCEDHPVRVDRIVSEIRLEGPLEEQQRARLLEIAERCPVHRTLEAGVNLETRPAEAWAASGSDRKHSGAPSKS